MNASPRVRTVRSAPSTSFHNNGLHINAARQTRHSSSRVPRAAIKTRKSRVSPLGKRAPRAALLACCRPHCTDETHRCFRSISCNGTITVRMRISCVLIEGLREVIQRKASRCCFARATRASSSSWYGAADANASSASPPTLATMPMTVLASPPRAASPPPRGCAARTLPPG